MTFQNMNHRGVFITLTAFILAGALLAVAANVQKVRLVEEDAIGLALASEQNNSARMTLLSGIRTIYSNAGITWAINDNNLTYFENFININQKNKISSNLSNFTAFAYQQFPNTTYNIAGTDIGKIVVTGKDLNMIHSTTGGFGTGKDLNMVYASQKFTSLIFDINAVAVTVTNAGQNFPLCSSCANPVSLKITVRNVNGTTSYSFNNIIDFNQSGSLDLNTSNSPLDMKFRYVNGNIYWGTTATDMNLTTTLSFNDAIFAVGLDKTLFTVNESSGFNIKSP